MRERLTAQYLMVPVRRYSTLGPWWRSLYPPATPAWESLPEAEDSIGIGF